MSNLTLEERAEVFRSCHYNLSGHPRLSPKETLSQIAANIGPHDEFPADVYGTGKLIENFEQKIADFHRVKSDKYRPI